MSLSSVRLIPERILPARVFLLATLVVVVSLVVVAVHWPALSAQALSFDDSQYLTDNLMVQNPSWTSAGRFLTEVLEPSTVGGYYQPLSMISLMLDHATGGRADYLLPFHRTSLALHVANTALIILLLWLLFDQPWIAAAAGLLFGVHPMTVEPIAWVGERKTLLAAFFALSCLILYVRFARKGGWKLYAGCTLMYVLALMSKPTSLPLPALMLVLDFWPLKRLNRKVVAQKIPLFALGVVSAIIAYVSQARTAEVILPAQYGLLRIPLVLCHNIVFYLYKIVWPVNLSSHYAFPEPLTLSQPMILAGVLGTCVLFVLLAVSLRWTKALLASWLFFFLAILPTMQIVGFSGTIAANKFAYLPSVGLLIIMVVFLAWLSRKLVGLLPVRMTVAILILALAFCESVATRRHLVHWQQPESYLQYMSSLNPGSMRLHDFLGTVLAKQGKDAQAISHFKEALHLNADYAGTYNNLGIVLARQGNLDQAIGHFVKATELAPDDSEAYGNLAHALLLQGNTDAALVQYQRALELEPNAPDALNGLAWVLATHEAAEFRNGAEAVRLATKACELTLWRDPEFLDTLAAAHAETGQFTEAQRTAEKAIELCVSAGTENLAKKIVNRRQLYEKKRPFRVNPASQ